VPSILSIVADLRDYKETYFSVNLVFIFVVWGRAPSAQRFSVIFMYNIHFNATKSSDGSKNSLSIYLASEKNLFLKIFGGLSPLAPDTRRYCKGRYGHLLLHWRHDREPVEQTR